MGLPLAVPLSTRVDFEGPVQVCRVTKDGIFKPIATLPMPPVDLEAGSATALLEVAGRVTVTDRAEFDAFAGEMMASEEFVVGMRGRVGVGMLGGWVGIRGGWLEKAVKMKGEGFGNSDEKQRKVADHETQISITGMNGLSKVAVTSVQVLSGTPRGIQMTSPANLENPAPISADLGDVSFILLAPAAPAYSPEDPDTRPSSPANGEPPKERLIPLGSILMPNLSLKPGVNEVPSVLATFHPDLAHPVARRTGLALLKSYLTNQPSTVVIRGYPGSTPIPYLSGACAGLEIRTALPGLPEKFIEQANLILPTPGDLWKLNLRSKLKMKNPFDCPMQVNGVTGKVTIVGGLNSGILSGLSAYLPSAIGATVQGDGQNTDLGTINADPLPTPIALTPLSTSTSPALAMQPLISVPALTGILSQLSEGKLSLTVDVEADMKVMVGDYDVGRLGAVGYRQEGVSVAVSIL